MAPYNNIKNYSIQDITSLIDFSFIDSFVISGIDRKIPDLFLEYPHSIEGVAISICTRGSGKFRVALKEYQISSGTLIVLIPDLIIEPLEKSKDLNLETIFFSYDYIPDLQLPTHFNILEKVMASPCIPLSNENYNTLLNYYTFLGERYSRDIHYYKPMIIKSLVFAFIGEVLSIYSVIERMSVSKSRTENLTNHFVELLLKNYKMQHNVSFYADQLCITPKYLMTLIKQSTGKPISTWINNAIISHAKRELKSTDKSIYIISEELNFPSSSQFCRYFKKHTGFTPKKYRDV